MSKATTLFIGVDVHKDSIPVVYVEEVRGSDVVAVGQIDPRHGDLNRLVRRLRSKASRLVSAYEVASCGYVV